MRLSKAIEQYLDYVRFRSESKKTFLRVRGVLRRFTAVIGNKDLRNITPADIIKYQAECRRQGNKTRTVNTNRKNLSGFFKWAEDNDIIKGTPLRSIHRLREAPSPPPRVLGLEDWERMKAAARCIKKLFHRLRALAILSLLQYMGLRKGEITAIQLEDIDFAKRNIRVRGKGDKVRIQPMPEVAVPAILELYQEAVKRKHVYLVSSLSGRPFEASSFHDMWKALLRRAGLPSSVRIHDGRHSFAAYCAERGVPLPVLKHLLGHEHLSSTEVYIQGFEVERAADREIRKRVFPEQIDMEEKEADNGSSTSEVE